MKKFLVILGILMLASMGMVLFNVTGDIAFATDGTIQTDCSVITQTDTPNGINIHSYVNEFYQMTSSKYLTSQSSGGGTLFFNNGSSSVGTGMHANIEANGDDNIVKIIPKAYFTYSNETLYIGKEYGFYINTSQSGSCYKSTVIIIDVTNTLFDDYAMDSKVQIIAQIDFLYVDQPLTTVSMKRYNTNNQFEGTSLGITLSGVQNAVVPIFSIEEEILADRSLYYKRFCESQSYTVSDISFASSLYNVNSLNAGDDHYDIDNDYGYFYTGNNYYYSATQVTSGDKETACKNILQSVTSTLLGFIPCSYFTNILAIGGMVVDVASNLYTISNGLTYDSTNESMYYEDVFTHNTRSSQKQAFGYLLKSSAIAINSNKHLLFKTNNYARGLFHFTHTDKADGSVEHNKIKLEYGLKIIDNQRKDVEIMPIQSVVYDINQPRVDNVSLFEQTEYYAINGAPHSFRFVPDYDGEYVISLENEDVQLFVNGENVQIIDNKAVVTFAKDSVNIIALSPENASHIFGDFTIDVNEMSNSKNISLSGNGTYIVKYKTDYNYMRRITAINGVIANVCSKTSMNNLVRLQTLHSFKELESVDAFFNADCDYYIVVKNPAAQTTQIQLAVSDVTETLNSGASVSLDANANFKYIRFVPTADNGHDYEFLFDGMVYSNDHYDFKLINEIGEIEPINIYSKGYVKAFSLNKNKNYWLGIYSTIEKDTPIEVVESPAIFKWKVLCNGQVLKYSSDRSITLERNNTYTFELWINDQLLVVLNRVDDDVYNRDGLTVFNDVTHNVEIKSIRAHRTPFTVVGVKDDDSIFDLTLTVIPVYNKNELSISEFSASNGISVTFGFPSAVNRINYRLTTNTRNGNKVIDFVVQNNRDSNYIIDIMQKLADIRAIGTATISFRNVETQFGEINDIHEVNKSVTINCQYDSSETKLGTTTYHIINALQLSNIDLLSGNVEIDNDIDVSTHYSHWKPIPSWNNTLKGKGHTIRGININATTAGTNDIGFIGVVNGNVLNLKVDVNIYTSAQDTSNTWRFIGGIAGRATSSGSIMFCTVTGSITPMIYYASVGGVVGDNSGTVGATLFGTETTSVTLSGTGDLGGIAGKSVNAISSCTVRNATISHTVIDSERSIGGVVGYCVNGVVEYCDIIDSVIANLNTSLVRVIVNMGYIAGHMQNSTLTECTQTDCTPQVQYLFPFAIKNCFQNDNELVGKRS